MAKQDGYSLTYISRKLRSAHFRFLKRFGIPQLPAAFLPKRTKSLRFRRTSWIVNVARFAIIAPIEALQVYSKPRPTIRFKQKRPIWRFFRPRHLFQPMAVLPPPAGAGAGTYLLPYVSRRLRIYNRPSRQRFPQQNVRSQPQKRRLIFRYRMRRPLWRFFRPKHAVVFLPTPPQVIGGGSYLLPYVSRRLRIFNRPKHIYSPRPAVFAFKIFRTPRIKQKRPLWRFFRPKHIYGLNPPKATGFFPRKPGPRPRIKRGRWNNLAAKRRLLYFAFTPPVTTGVADWLTRYRRRGRR